MSLFSRLLTGKKSQRDRLEKELADLERDGRMHARVRLHDESLATLTLASGLVGFVADLSYGGVAVRFAAAAFPFKPSEQTEGNLKILHHHTRLSMNTVRRVNHSPTEIIVGFCLRHEAAESLLFLREFIEPSKCGESLGLIKQALRQSRYQSPQWHCWRGDGPTDLIAQTMPDTGELSEAILTFRLNKTYCELTLKNGLLKTNLIRNEDESTMLNGTARVMAGTASEDMRVLRTAIFILQASPLLCRQLTAPLISLARQQLDASSLHGVTGG